ncbi:MAG TPA: response regulator [Sphingomonas sp.]|jgi:two-component system response regulator FixJ|nr:response regulator [Sphingomonas sp.]
MSDGKRVVQVVDDDAAIRQSLSFMLGKAGYDVVCHVTGAAFLKAANPEMRGCVLLDIRMPGLDGLEVQEQLAQRGIALPVIMLTGHGDIALAVRAIKAGAVEFLEKPFERQSLISALEIAFDRADRAGREQLAAADAAVRLAVLTPRERTVLDGMVAGRPNKLIAFELDIATRTVEVHRAKLMEKLGARSLSGVLRIAFAAGLGDEE